MSHFCFRFWVSVSTFISLAHAKCPVGYRVTKTFKCPFGWVSLSLFLPHSPLGWCHKTAIKLAHRIPNVDAAVAPVEISMGEEQCQHQLCQLELITLARQAHGELRWQHLRSKLKEKERDLRREISLLAQVGRGTSISRNGPRRGTR